jgi:hypothetical protein
MTRANAERGARSRRLLADFARAMGDPDASVVTLATDVLADLMHLADEDGWAFDDALATARAHVAAEKKEASAAARERRRGRRRAS